MSDDNTSIGYIVGGGLKEGFNIRLTVPADTVQEGSFQWSVTAAVIVTMV
ncbi:MAG: hypothetical protein R3C44_00360 [Chloroflexota bacterium]